MSDQTPVEPESEEVEAENPPYNQEDEVDVFGGEEDETTREEIEKNLLTDSDNSPRTEEGEEYVEVEE